MQFISQACKPQKHQQWNSSLALKLTSLCTETLKQTTIAALWMSGNNRSCVNSLLGFKVKILTPRTLVFMNTDPGSVTSALPRCPGHLKRHAASAGSSLGRFDENWCCSVFPMSILNISIKSSRAGRPTSIRCILGNRPGAGVTLMWPIKVFRLTYLHSGCIQIRGPT